jgi:hypothetical protein
MVENNVGPSTAAVTVTASRAASTARASYAVYLFCFSKRKGASLALIKSWRICCVSVESYRLQCTHCLHSLRLGWTRADGDVHDDF